MENLEDFDVEEIIEYVKFNEEGVEYDSEAISLVEEIRERQKFISPKWDW